VKGRERSAQISEKRDGGGTRLVSLDDDPTGGAPKKQENAQGSKEGGDEKNALGGRTVTNKA